VPTERDPSYARRDALHLAATGKHHSDAEPSTSGKTGIARIVGVPHWSAGSARQQDPEGWRAIQGAVARRRRFSYETLLRIWIAGFSELPMMKGRS